MSNCTYLGYVRYKHPSTGRKFYRALVLLPAGERTSRRTLPRVVDAVEWGLRLARRMSAMSRVAADQPPILAPVPAEPLYPYEALRQLDAKND